jgi:hypothetical protein
MIRLTPPPGRILYGIKSKLEERRTVEKELNRAKMSSMKKRKHDKSLNNNHNHNHKHKHNPNLARFCFD